jgi:ADP-heptose:LPS heptosyltransferase
MTTFRVQPDAQLINSSPFNLLDAAIALTDFHGTAYRLKTLDFIITVASSVTHLVGDLHLPVWALYPSTPGLKQEI